MDRDTIESDPAPSARGWLVPAAVVVALVVVGVIGAAVSAAVVSDDDASPVAAAGRSVAVYYLDGDADGDAPVAGPRLHRELVAVPPRVQALDAALAALTATPTDPELHTGWQPGAFAGIREVDGTVEVLVADPTLVGASTLSRPEARARVQQVVYTLQAAAGHDLPVRFTYAGAPAERILGVDASGAFIHGSDTRAGQSGQVPPVTPVTGRMPS